MDEPLSPLNPMKCVKTYSKAFTSHSKLKTKSQNASTLDLTSNNDVKNEENNQNKTASKNDQHPSVKGLLTTKNAVKLLLDDTLKDQVCRYCLNTCENLSSLEEVITIGTRSGIYSIAVKEMIASFYPLRVDTNPSFPSKICSKCLNRTINSYLFTQQCDQSDRALQNCFEDIFEKVEKLDPLERTKKRGRQKLKPNYNIINAEHKYVIDYAEPKLHIISTINNSPDEPKIQDLECLKCAQILPDIISLLNHIKTHPKSTWFNCRLCGKSFPKLQHIKKHFRSEHDTKTIQKDNTNIKKDPSNFNCNECGLIYRNYQEFLQHIEKHKFKTTLEHVLTCKMDKLCTICFDKGSNMVSVEKEINLNGGFEELTGDKSVGSMISATLPEKHYKYQELYVAKQANIITLRKRINSQKSPKSSNFIFTSPFIFHDEKMNEYANVLDDYIFIFDEPRNNCEDITFKEPEAKKNKHDDELLEITKDSNKKSTKSENSELLAFEKENSKEIHKHQEKDNKTELIFSFSNPLIDVDKILMEIDKKNNFDKVVLFERKNEALEKQNNEKINQEDEIVKEDIKSKEKDKLQEELISHAKDNEIKSWHCSVCLTNNKAQRGMCFCCENTTYNDVTKFNFNPTSSYNDQDTSLNISTEDTNTYEKNYAQNVVIDTSVQTTNKIDNISNEKKARDHQEYESKDDEMETEIIPNNETNIFENKITTQEFIIMTPPQIYETQHIEAMEIEENPINEFCNNIISHTQTNNLTIPHSNDTPNKDKTWSTSLQFNIGTGSGDKGKRNKRPFRNVTRAFHK